MRLVRCEFDAIMARNGGGKLEVKRGQTSSFMCSSIATIIKPYNQDLRRVAMSIADTYVRARIDTVTKERAADALGAMGLSTRMLFAC